MLKWHPTIMKKLTILILLTSLLIHNYSYGQTDNSKEIKKSDRVVRNFLIEQFKILKGQTHFDEILQTQIHPLLLANRFQIIKQKINSIVNS